MTARQPKKIERRALLEIWNQRGRKIAEVIHEIRTSSGALIYSAELFNS